jgi:FixJ family two-component response regulator
LGGNPADDPFDPRSGFNRNRQRWTGSSAAGSIRHCSTWPCPVQVIRQLAKGMGNNEIAAELNVGNKTVGTRKAWMMEDGKTWPVPWA